VEVKTAFDGAMADAAAFNKKLHVFWWGVGAAETGIYNSMQETRADSLLLKMPHTIAA
jgi:hypothetical protein